MKKYLTNIEAHNELMNEQYVNNNFKTVEEIDLIVKQHMINNFK
tara:strand:- start:300 stop:431 length:132 start_codon:yes stop_codon:yes gene_type:complete